MAMAAPTKTHASARPHKSPYAGPLATLHIGPNAHTYHAPADLLPETLRQCHEWIGPAAHTPDITLPDLDDDTAHVLLHYLHTGAYQTLDARAQSPHHEAQLEFRRAMAAYIAAVRYEIGGLAALARHEVVRWGAGLSVFDAAMLLEGDFAKVQDEAEWVREWVREKCRAAFEADYRRFARMDVFDGVGDVVLNRWLMKCLVELLSEKVALMGGGEPAVDVGVVEEEEDVVNGVSGELLQTQDQGVTEGVVIETLEVPTEPPTPVGELYLDEDSIVAAITDAPSVPRKPESGISYGAWDSRVENGSSKNGFDYEALNAALTAQQQGEEVRTDTDTERGGCFASVTERKKKGKKKVVFDDEDLLKAEREMALIVEAGIQQLEEEEAELERQAEEEAELDRLEEARRREAETTIEQESEPVQQVEAIPQPEPVPESGSIAEQEPQPEPENTAEPSSTAEPEPVPENPFEGLTFKERRKLAKKLKKEAAEAEKAQTVQEQVPAAPTTTLDTQDQQAPSPSPAAENQFEGLNKLQKLMLLKRMVSGKKAKEQDIRAAALAASLDFEGEPLEDTFEYLSRSQKRGLLTELIEKEMAEMEAEAMHTDGKHTTAPTTEQTNQPIDPPNPYPSHFTTTRPDHDAAYPTPDLSQEDAPKPKKKKAKKPPSPTSISLPSFSTAPATDAPPKPKKAKKQKPAVPPAPSPPLSEDSVLERGASWSEAVEEEARGLGDGVDGGKKKKKKKVKKGEDVSLGGGLQGGFAGQAPMYL